MLSKKGHNVISFRIMILPNYFKEDIKAQKSKGNFPKARNRLVH